jgi:hypothetical protein
MGRLSVNAEIIALVRSMAHANSLWGAPRIHGELLKLGIDVAERTVSRLIRSARCLPRRRGARSSRTMSGAWSRSTCSPFPPLGCGCSSSSSCSLTIGAESYTSTSPSIPPRRGPAKDRSAEGIDGPNGAVQTVVLKVLRNQLGQAVRLRIRPQVSVEPAELIRGPASDSRAQQ